MQTYTGNHSACTADVLALNHRSRLYTFICRASKIERERERNHEKDHTLYVDIDICNRACDVVYCCAAINASIVWLNMAE